MDITGQLRHRLWILDGDASIAQFDPPVTLEIAQDGADGFAVGSKRVGLNLMANAHLVVVVIPSQPEQFTGEPRRQTFVSDIFQAIFNLRQPASKGEKQAQAQYRVLIGEFMRLFGRQSPSDAGFYRMNMDS